MTSLHDDRSEPPTLTAANEPEPDGQGAAACRDDTSLRLADMHDRPLAEHADLFETLHAQLQIALADIDHG